MPKIRTTMEPDKVVEVTDKELIDLQRWGLVLPAEVSVYPAPTEYTAPVSRPQQRSSKSGQTADTKE